MKFSKKTVLLNQLTDERGAGTAFAMLFALICIGIGGLAIDSSNVWSVKQRLQAATDISAHAAAISLVWPDDPDGPSGTPTEVAIATLLANAPEAQFGVALQASDVEIGFWHPVSGRIVESHLDELGNDLDKAVSVTARLDGEVGNVVPTFLLKLIGFDYWKVSTRSVFIRDTPWCVDGGFIAAGIVDVASNNSFYNGFCMHGNEGVDVNDNVIFGEGVRLSMPDSAPLVDGGMLALKGTTYDWADGKENQIGDQWLEPSLASVTSILDIKAALLDPYSESLPDYFNGQAPDVIEIDVTPSTPLTADQLASGAIYDISCPVKGLNIPDSIVISDVIIVANCKINFGQGAVISSSTILTTDTGNQSLNGPSSLVLGRDDDCRDGGGVSLITMGDAHFSAQTEWYGTEVIANGDVHISAIAGGIEGISVESGGDIFATSNLGFGLCNRNVDHYREHYIIRMVY